MTGTIYSATDGSDDALYGLVEPQLRTKVGRLLNDKMPTGVAVSPAMNHGGPFPATGSPQFTAVGVPASITRWAALWSYDAIRPYRLPPALQDANPNGTMFTPEQRGAVDGDGDGDGDGGPPGIDQFTDDHAFNAQNSTMVWGTTISLHESMTNAKQFLRDFAADDGEPLYPQLLKQAKEDESYNLNIDSGHLRTFDREHDYNLYRDLVRYPQEMIPIFDLCVYEEFQRMFGEEES